MRGWRGVGDGCFARGAVQGGQERRSLCYVCMYMHIIYVYLLYMCMYSFFLYTFIHIPNGLFIYNLVIY